MVPVLPTDAGGKVMKWADFEPGQKRALDEVIKAKAKVRGFLQWLAKRIQVDRSTLVKRAAPGRVMAVAVGRPPAAGATLEEAACNWIRNQCIIGNCAPIAWIAARMRMIAASLGKNPLLLGSNKQIYAMLKRGGLSVKDGELTTIMRCNAVTKEHHAGFMANLAAVGGKDAPPEKLVNMDESALIAAERNKTVRVAGVPNRKARVLKGAQTTMPSHLSMAPCVNAAGRLAAKTLLIISGSRRFEAYVGSFPTAVVIMSNSGGMEEDTWIAYVRYLCVTLEKGTILLVDNHCTRYASWRALLALHEAGIHLVTMPANGTDVYQLLDVAYFRPFRKFFDDRKVLDSWHTASSSLPSILKAAYETELSLFAPTGANAGIAKAAASIGLYPHNPHAISDDVFKPAEAAAAATAAAYAAAGIQLPPKEAATYVTQYFGPPVTTAHLAKIRDAKDAADAAAEASEAAKRKKDRYRYTNVLTSPEVIARIAHDKLAAEAEAEALEQRKAERAAKKAAKPPKAPGKAAQKAAAAAAFAAAAAAEASAAGGASEAGGSGGDGGGGGGSAAAAAVGAAPAVGSKRARSRPCRSGTCRCAMPALKRVRIVAGAASVALFERDLVEFEAWRVAPGRQLESP